MKIKRQLSFEHKKDLLYNFCALDRVCFHKNNCELSELNILQPSRSESVKDKSYYRKSSSDEDDSKKENPYENLAGPSLIYEALDHVRRLNGTKKISKPLKVRYLSEDLRQRINALEEQLEKEGFTESKKTSEDTSNLRENITCQDKFSNKDSSSKHNLNSNLKTEKYKSFKDIELDDKDDDSLFYRKAMQHVKRMNNEKKAVLAKIGNNFKLFLIIIVAFAGYYAYNVYTRSDEELSVSALQAKLPLKLDTYTTLQKVSLDDNSLNLEVIKSKESFQNIKDPNSALNVYIQSASSNFCKIPLFSDMIKKGRRISVLIKADDDSFNKEFVVSHCDK